MIQMYKSFKTITTYSLKEYPAMIKQKIRTLAVSRADKRMIIYGIDLNDIEPIQYEGYVYDEERKIYEDLKNKSISLALALILGIQI